MANVITVNDLSKFYRIGEWSSLAGYVKKRLTGKSVRPTIKHALQNISFSVDQGQAVGVIGRNGAGKTTLFRLLAGITLPTTGHIQIRGKMAALIALGAGFQSELTGRENVYLNAAILGLSEKEINQRFDSIVDFSEIGEYIDTPIKRYSSGMNARLAFSVYAHVNADIMLVDEVLSVGDLRFSLKCHRYFSRFRQEGGTLFLISHSLQLVRNVTTRTIWLENGQLVMDGSTQDVCDAYESRELTTMNAATDHERVEGRRVNMDSDIQIRNVEFLNANDLPQESFNIGEPITVRIHYSAKRLVSAPIFTVSAFTPEDLAIFSIYSSRYPDVIKPLLHDGFVDLKLTELNLGIGHFRVSVTCSEGDVSSILDWHEKLYTFVVVGERQTYGLLVPRVTWQHKLEEVQSLL